MENYNQPQWYCVRTQPKHEHIAAAHLQRLSSLEIFCPQVRFQRPTVRGSKWFVEAMFPGYLFARFCLAAHQLRVRYCPGVSTILKFGSVYATLEPEVIEGIRLQLQRPPARSTPPAPGDSVAIACGSLRGLEAVVTEALPGKERVRILIDFLGRKIEAEVSRPSIVRVAA